MAKKEEIVGWGETPLVEMSFEELLERGVIDISEIDDVVQVKQDELVGKTFILVTWDISTSSTVTRDGQPTQYATCKVRTNEGLRIFSDGGAGIMDQLERYKSKVADEPNALLYFHYGLRVSEYQYTDPVTGDKSPAKTFYFDNRPRP